jgi:hypothetical protein
MKLLPVVVQQPSWAGSGVGFLPLTRLENPVPIAVAVLLAALRRDLPFMVFLLLVMLLAMVFFQVRTTLPLHLRAFYDTSERGIGLLLWPGFPALAPASRKPA